MLNSQHKIAWGSDGWMINGIDFHKSFFLLSDEDEKEMNCLETGVAANGGEKYTMALASELWPM